MICLPAEMQIDEESIIAQMDRVEEAQRKYESELNKLRRMFYGVRVREKRDYEESPKI